MSFSIKDTLKRGLSSGSQSDDPSLQIKKTENLPPSTSTTTTTTSVAAVVEVRKEDIKDTLDRGLSSRSQSDPSLQIKRTENLPPTTSVAAVLEVQKEDKIEIHVKSEGEIEEIHIYKVPLKYLSYVTFGELLKRSGEDLNNISGGQQINICCKFELFEKILKLVKWKELEAKYRESSYDDRLWQRELRPGL